MKQYDAIIIGFGKGGKTLAAELSNHGWSVALVERSEKMYGGTCINVACVPTKTLIHEAEVSGLMYQGDYKKQSNFYKLAIGRKNKLTSFLRDKNYSDLAQRSNVTIYTGTASFICPDTVKVTLPDEELELQGKEIFINTGSTSILPSIDGIRNSKRVYSSSTLLELEVLPKHLIIIGAGYIGLEFASMYAEFGSEVTLLESGDLFMPNIDRDIADNVREVFQNRGIEVRLNARAQSIHDTADGVTIAYTDASDGTPYFVDGDAILLATGRKPLTDGLNLQAAVVQVDPNGAIKTDAHLHTTTPHIWAMGDVKGGPQFTYISLDDFRIIRNKLFGGEERTTEDRNPVAYSIFMDPPLAHVGITEEEAIKQGYTFKVSRLPATAVARARTLHKVDGMMKAIVDAKTGKIMGCTLFCAEAPEMINVVNVAMKTGQHYSFLRDFIFTHPSMSEVFNQLFSFD